jgi:hypothetical protein
MSLQCVSCHKPSNPCDMTAPSSIASRVNSMRPWVMRDTSSRSSTSRVSCVTWRLIASTLNWVFGSPRAVIAS